VIAVTERLTGRGRGGRRGTRTQENNRAPQTHATCSYSTPALHGCEWQTLVESSPAQLQDCAACPIWSVAENNLNLRHL